MAEAEVATCFYAGGHSAPDAAWDLVLAFFGLQAAGPGPGPPSGSHCADIGCGNHNSRCWCNSGCKQHGDCCADYSGTCGAPGACPATASCGHYSCDEWVAWDPAKYSCAELEREFGCDCRGCQLCGG